MFCSLYHCEGYYNITEPRVLVYFIEARISRGEDHNILHYYYLCFLLLFPFLFSLRLFSLWLFTVYYSRIQSRGLRGKREQWSVQIEAWTSIERQLKWVHAISLHLHVSHLELFKLGTNLQSIFLILSSGFPKFWNWRRFWDKTIFCTLIRYCGRYPKHKS